MDFRKDDFYENGLASLIQNIKILTGNEFESSGENKELVETLKRAESLDNFKNALSLL